MNLSTEKKIMDLESGRVACLGEERRSGRDWELGVKGCKILILECIYNEFLLGSIENYD